MFISLQVLRLWSWMLQIMTMTDGDSEVSVGLFKGFWGSSRSTAPYLIWHAQQPWGYQGWHLWFPPSLLRKLRSRGLEGFFPLGGCMLRMSRTRAGTPTPCFLSVGLSSYPGLQRPWAPRLEGTHHICGRECLETHATLRKGEIICRQKVWLAAEQG